MLTQQADDIAFSLRDCSYRKHMNCCNHASIITKGEVYEVSEGSTGNTQFWKACEQGNGIAAHGLHTLGIHVFLLG